MAELLACPFCGHRTRIAGHLQLHIDAYHPDGSPSVMYKEAPGRLDTSKETTKRGSSHGGRTDTVDDSWTRCTRPGCGQMIALTEIDEHLGLHTAMDMAEEDSLPQRRPSSSRAPSEAHPRSARSDRSHVHASSSPPKLQKSHPSSPSNQSRTTSLLSYFAGVPAPNRTSARRIREPEKPGRLGKRELGPFAYEKKMPSRVRDELLDGARPRLLNRIGRDGRLVRESYIPNETRGLIRILGDLCALDPSTEATYLCHPSVKHIYRLPCDGNFCGYWNIQVMLSFMQHINPAGPQRLPNVIQIQDVIELAWTKGICPYGKIETGGVLNTRKWIGTHEALAFFTQVGAKVDALAFQDGPDQDRRAADNLLDHIEAYFMSGIDAAQTHGTSYITQLAPVYLQRLGHSMSIVGLERRRDGGRNLLVFDSSYSTTELMDRLLAGRNVHAPLETLLRPYRKVDESLGRWNEFEIVVCI